MVGKVKTEARLHEGSFKKILENIDDPIAVCDCVDTIVYYNSAYGKYFLDRKRSLTSDDIRSGGPECPYCHTANSDKKFEARDLGEFEHRGRVYRHTTDILPSTNGAVFCQHIFRDITSGKETEKELIAANRRAELSENLKKSFLANISHEIRTPMNAIMGFSSLLDLDDLDENERSRYIEVIKTSSDSLLKIVDSIILYSRIISNDIKVNNSPVDLPLLINETISTFREKLLDDPERLQIHADLPVTNGTPVLNADCALIRIVLSQLLDNAWKFTKRGRIDIGFRVTGSSQEPMVRLFVRDTGIGIPDEHKGTIFEPFRQAEDAITKKFSGTGLGLSIVRELVERMGTRITFVSHEGSGTEFRFELPATPAQ